MKERPILYTGAMVRAILEGRKTETRRVVKPSNSSVLGYNVAAESEEWSGLDFSAAIVLESSIWGEDFHLSVPWKHSTEADYSDGVRYRVRPRYDTGDVLWVRETFAERSGDVIYRADSKFNVPEECVSFEPGDKWKPSIFMPRWLSRISTIIVKIRAERVQEINRGGCMAEGCPFQNLRTTDPLKWYSDLWDSINGKKPGRAWKDNPWVWVIEFKI